MNIIRYLLTFMWFVQLHNFYLFPKDQLYAHQDNKILYQSNSKFFHPLRKDQYIILYLYLLILSWISINLIIYSTIFMSKMHNLILLRFLDCFELVFFLKISLFLFHLMLYLNLKCLKNLFSMLLYLHLKKIYSLILKRILFI